MGAITARLMLRSRTPAAGVSGRLLLRGRETRTKKITYNTKVAAQLCNVREEICSLAAQGRKPYTSFCQDHGDRP